MNRLGFWLLTIGLTLALIGGFYNHQVVTLIGLAPLLVLAGVATFVPSAIAFDVREAQARRQPRDIVWLATMGFAGLIALAGFAHTRAGGDGLAVLAGGAFLAAVMAGYAFTEEAQVRRFATRVRHPRVSSGLGASHR